MELAERARKYTDLALGVFVETIKATKYETEVDAKGKVTVKEVHRYSNDMRQRAADALLNRAWGTPTQSHMLQGAGPDGAIPVTHSFPDLKGLPVDELAKLYRSLVAPNKD